MEAEAEVEAEVEAEAEVEVEVEAEEQEQEEHPLNPPIKETSENKEHYPKNLKEIAPKPRNLSRTCEATFT